MRQQTIKCKSRVESAELKWKSRVELGCVSTALNGSQGLSQDASADHKMEVKG